MNKSNYLTDLNRNDFTGLATMQLALVLIIALFSIGCTSTRIAQHKRSAREIVFEQCDVDKDCSIEEVLAAANSIDKE